MGIRKGLLPRFKYLVSYKIEDPFALGAVIDLGNCLDLAETTSPGIYVIPRRSYCSRGASTSAKCGFIAATIFASTSGSWIGAVWPGSVFKS